ncbi:SDR family NAD(P)-dependent oxidoreductase [Secundilactobacillus malefermentans]|uniref:Uncharacterized protein n=1 Tax=Secundilactobacillus malefermentans TaxID=176292 RepID=A0A4V3A3R8_9LACO|nr:SDR family oxidoreductase [Secundilactobacillus malefermentans]KRM59253.1 short chain dehydrogenase reductase family oxidoreductase [Secundilactobacillus malefermentans DSM 5705 = KCTC 3548]QEA32363.1 SDR family oxidoreductase [Secundilactobacillus malefermentans]TDG76243.1 hypothetical protein C5L31_000856 [Secundilactobacillus malefermentans]
MSKVVIVTGGTSGIGYQTVAKFLREGATVVIAGIDKQEKIDNAVKKLAALGIVEFIKCDVSNRQDCQHVIDATIQKYCHLDVLANVAGIVGARKSFTDISLDEIEKVINVNLMGTINMGHYAAKEMTKQKSGVIINVGSIDGFLANPENVAYHASKGGVKMLTAAEGRELGAYGIRVVSVAPGWVRTEMLGDFAAAAGGKLHMKGRILEPEEIANTIYLVSLPEASAINGTTVFADDGYTAFKGIDIESKIK